MNKKILITGALLVVIGAAHSAFWFYQSTKIKASIEQAAGTISKEVGRKNTELFYTSSDISGYPLNFTVRINQPKFISAGGGEKLEISSGDQPLVVISNLLGNRYEIHLPAKMDIKQTIDDTEKSYKLEFAGASPVIEAKFPANFLFDLDNHPELLSYLSDRLKSAKYQDSGYNLTALEGSTKVASSGASLIQITKTSGAKNSVSTAYNLKLEHMDIAALFSPGTTQSSDSGATSALWPITTNIDFSSIDSKDESGKSTSVEFVVRDFDVKATSFGLGIKGGVKANGSDIFPFGDLSVKINNYKNMVDYFGTLVSNALAQTNIPLFHIKTEKSIDFKKVLYDIASEKSNEDKDILLTLSREQGKSLFIGQKGLMEVVDLLKASAAPDPITSKDGSTAPLQHNAPVLDLSPASKSPETGSPLVLPNTVN